MTMWHESPPLFLCLGGPCGGLYRAVEPGAGGFTVYEEDPAHLVGRFRVAGLYHLAVARPEDRADDRIVLRWIAACEVVPYLSAGVTGHAPAPDDVAGNGHGSAHDG